MDLEIREALAFSDRAAADAQLLPGSEDHDFYRCLHAQHASRLAEADQILAAWPERHGTTERYQRLRARQLLYRAANEPARVADELRDLFGANHGHEAEVEAEGAPTRPTRLPDGAFDGATLLARAVAHDSNLSQVTDEGLYELIGQELDTTRRRALLSRLQHTPEDAVVDHVATELATKGSSGFGALAIHGQLTLAQLHALARIRTELAGNSNWVVAVLQRMRPPAGVELELDLAARAAYLDELWQFLVDLPSAHDTLKAHVLWHVLDTARRRSPGPVDAKLFQAYLALPRTASYLARPRERGRGGEVAHLGQDLRHATGLGPAGGSSGGPGGDEELVRDLLQRDRDHAEAFAPWIDRAWLDTEVATATLLYGDPGADQATRVLGPARAAALRDRVELAWCPHNPTRFSADETIALAADVKNVGELVVKVFRIDPVAYFEHHRRDVNTDLDLDGLAASHEQTIAILDGLAPMPAIRRVRQRIELAACARPGTYVIDLIGNGISSRALVEKGRLRHTVRIGAAGHVVTIVDEAGRPRPDARAILGEREYTPDDRGTFVVAFSTSPQRMPMLLVCGDLATVTHLDLVRESCQLFADLVLDRESFAAGGTARAIARVALRIAGAPASLALLQRASWEVTLTDRAGVATTKSFPLALSDDDAAVLEWPMGGATARVALAIRGTVEIRSEQREQELSDSRTFEVATIHDGTEIEALYLARVDGGFTISALGKTGEPRAHRPVTIVLGHRWARTQQTVELATDARGRLELGELPGVAWISATLGGLTQRWDVGDADLAAGFATVAGAEVVVPLPPGRTAAEVVRRASLIELRASVPFAHPAHELVPVEGALVIRGLGAGDYALRAPGVTATVVVTAPGAIVGTAVIAATEVVDGPRAVPVIETIATRDDTLRVQVRGATGRTRVHAIATRFASGLVAPIHLGPARSPVRRRDDRRGALYVSGRELGDEYRYVLERRNHKRLPGLLLDKPSLLLNPWSRRTTTTGVAHARAGTAHRASPPMSAPAPAPAPPPRPRAEPGTSAAFASHDFLPAPATVLANGVPDADGSFELARAALGDATSVTLVIDDPAGTTLRRVHLPERPLDPKDLRLVLALPPDRHAMQTKTITPLVAGERVVIEDLATARVHLIDSVERAHAYLLALGADATLREFAFVTRWHELDDAERRSRYSKYACHELHLFLHYKDRAFFDAVVRPHLAHKRTKTFLDHWLLDADLSAYLEPIRLARLNAVERALLASRLPADDNLVRILGDRVAIQPPDPATDTRLVDAMLGASELDADKTIDSLRAAAVSESVAVAAMPAMRGGATGAFAAPMEVADDADDYGGVDEEAEREPVATDRRRAKRMKKGGRMSAKADLMFDGGGGAGESLDDDRARRDEAPAHYRGVDQTQEWAEHNWWHRTPADCDGDMIEPTRLWRDLSRHRGGGFLSPWLGLATTSFAEAMCALAVIDLPFSAAKHATTADGPRLVITAGGNVLAGASQLVAGELATEVAGPPVVVGTSYVRTDDRYDWDSGEQRDKYVTGPFATGVVYTCQVVLANPSSARQRIAALVQIPRGSIPVAGARATDTLDVVLEAYGTRGHEYAFYFPSPGEWSHFGTHVTRDGAIIAAAPGATLVVTSGGGAPDPRSWPYVSQRGSLADVVAYLDGANLAAIDLERIAWRLRDRTAYDAILAALERRREYRDVLWAYALVHHDGPRIVTWLRTCDLSECGPVLDMLDVDAELLGTYEHLELAPLVNARAHRLGGKLAILNDGLVAQYDRFLELVAHRATPTSSDLLAAAHYLIAQDRVDAAHAVLARVRPDDVAERMQHDYLAAYLACITGELDRARELAGRWREHPVDRWRFRFAAIVKMLDEAREMPITETAVDPKSRDARHAALAAEQPAFDLELDRDGIRITSQRVRALELRFFEMDVELLFSQQPFVASDVSRFSYIEPGHREALGELPPEHRVPWPAGLRGKNVVVAAVGHGQRKAKVHYANDIVTSLANQVGQIRVQRTADRSPLAATYVKVYARQRGGGVVFYKDGYTDLRGWFDYATLSTGELDDVDRFAILVCSDQAGSTILEAAPPVR